MTFIAEDKTEVTISKRGNTTVVETINSTQPGKLTVPKQKKKVDLKVMPKFQSEDTPKTKKRYIYPKTGNYVCYARAKQLGLVD